jgi:elongation factor Ts
MTQISAAAVKALRDKTQLPMMECKRALLEADGDQEKAIRCLRERGRKTMVARSGRATNAGRIAIYTSIDAGVGAMVELQCESAPVAAHEDFRQLADDLARQLATGPGARTADELWGQPSPSHEGLTLAERRDEIANRIRETFRLARVVRIDAPCGGYLHHTAADGVLLEVSEGTAELAKEISMHIAAMRPGSG